MAEGVTGPTADALSNEGRPNADLPTTPATPTTTPALARESSRDAAKQERAWVRNLEKLFQPIPILDDDGGRNDYDSLGYPLGPRRASTPQLPEPAPVAPPAFRGAPNGPRPLQSHPVFAAAASAPAPHCDLLDPFVDDDCVLPLRQHRGAPPANSTPPSDSRGQAPFKLRLPAGGKRKPKPLKIAQQKPSTTTAGPDSPAIAARQNRPATAPIGAGIQAVGLSAPPPPSRSCLPLNHPPPPSPPLLSPSRDKGRRTDFRPAGLFASPLFQDSNTASTMNGINGGNMGAGMVVPTPAGHQTELNYIYAMVEDLSRQLEDNRRVLSEVVSLVGKIRSKARAQNVSNEEIITNAEDLNPENLDVLVSALSEALDRATHERDTNMALLQQYASVLGTMVRQAHEYKARNVSDVSAWHRSYREQLAEAREENSRLREQVWDMQERGGRLNELARRFRARYDAEPSRYESRVEHAALRQEVRFWKRMAMPEIPHDDPCWSDDDDLIDPAETKRLAEVERAAAALAAEQQLKLQLEDEQTALDQETQQQQQQYQDQQLQQDERVELVTNGASAQGSGDVSVVDGQAQNGRNSILGSLTSSENSQKPEAKGQQQKAGAGFSMGGVAMQREDPIP